MAYDPNISSDAQGNTNVAGAAIVGTPPATLETDVAGDLFVDPPNFHAPHIWTKSLNAEPADGQAIGYGTTPTSFVSLKGMPSTAPAFNDYYYAQLFTAGITADIVRVQLRVRLDPAFPVADASKIILQLALAPDATDVPGGATGSDTTLRGSQLTGGRFTRVDFSFSSPFSLASGGLYWLQLYVGTTDVGYAHTFQIEANSTPASLTVDSVDEESTWVAVLSQGTIAAKLDQTNHLGVQDAAVFADGVGVFGHAAPAVQPVLATGAAHSTDDVIALLQSYGLCKQS